MNPNRNFWDKVDEIVEKWEPRAAALGLGTSAISIPLALTGYGAPIAVAIELGGNSRPC